MTRRLPRRHETSRALGAESSVRPSHDAISPAEPNAWSYRNPIDPDEHLEHTNSGSTLENSCTSDDDIIFYEDVYREESRLEPNHPFQAVRRELARYATREMEAWEMRRDRPGRSLGRGRPRQSRGLDAVRFACPYYRADPRRFASCLKTCDLRTIKEVKKHLWTVHRQPAYCPTCLETFSMVAERDEHIQSRTCRARQDQSLEGITGRQRTLLARREDPRTSAEEHWFRIWDVVFPGLRRPGPAYLQSDLERAVCRMRVFWGKEGQRIVADFLRPRGLLSLDLADEERSLAVLYGSILDDMIDNRMASFRPEQLR